MSSSTLDPAGLGFWYDRMNRRWWRIRDHLVDALAYPQRSRLTAAEADYIRATPGGFEAQRAIGITLVASHGFIRVRLIRDRLGWQFHGDSEDSLRILRRFAARYELGPMVLVRWTDFGGEADAEQRLGHLLRFGVGHLTTAVIDPGCYPGAIAAARAPLAGIVRCVENWLTTGCPRRTSRWLRGITDASRTALRQDVPRLITVAVTGQNRYLGAPGRLFSGPYADRLPDLAARGRAALPRRVRLLARIVGINAAEAEHLIATLIPTES
jgi:hypothetical protein